MQTASCRLFASSSNMPCSTVKNGFASSASRNASIACRTGVGCEAMKKPEKWRYSGASRNNARTDGQSSSFGAGSVRAATSATSRPGTNAAPIAAPWNARKARRETVMAQPPLSQVAGA